MTYFMLEHPATTDYEWQLSNHLKYANFLKQPLKKGMFVPCDENDNVLETPIDIYYRPDFMCQKYPQECYEGDLKSYNKAKEKVLFDGFELIYCVENATCISNKKTDTNILFFNDGRILLDSKEIKEVKEVKTIEELVPYNLTLINKL